MADPKTWDLLGPIETCPRRITVTNGSYTNAGNHVTREPHQIPQSEQPEVLAIAMDSVSRAEEPALQRNGRLVGVLVVGAVRIDQDNAQLRAHQLIEDIQRAMGDQQQKFPVGTQFPRFVDARVIPPAEGMKWIGAEVRYAAHVRRS